MMSEVIELANTLPKLTFAGRKSKTPEQMRMLSNLTLTLYYAHYTSDVFVNCCFW